MLETPSHLSCFSGAGGLDLGLESAGFKNIGCIEWDEDSRRTLKKNRPLWEVFNDGDINHYTTHIEKVQSILKGKPLTLLSGAPPCQPYSTAALWNSNSRKGLLDKRALPFFSFLEIAKALSPEFILIENVKSFIQGEHSVLPILEEFCQSTDYKFSKKVLDAYDFGVPQMRKRAIVLLFKGSQNIEWPQPVSNEEKRNTWDAIGELDNDKNAYAPMRGKWANLLPSIPEGCNYQWHTDKGGGKELFGYRTRYWNFLLKLAKDRPSWTIAAQPGPSAGPFHWKNRPLTIQECACLQTFPSDWLFCGSKGEQMRQVGNATPPLLAEYLGEMILRCKDSKHPLKQKNLRIPSRSDCPEPEKVMPISLDYTHLIKKRKPHPGTGKGPAPRTKLYS